MEIIPMRSGGKAYLLGKGETCPAGEICFLREEWEYIKREAKSREGDPEDHRAFWESLIEAKKTIPGFIHMPEKMKEEIVSKHTGVDYKASKFKESPSGKIAEAIMETLRGRKS